MNKQPWALVGLAAVAIAAGCSTPASRIKKHPQIFEALPPEVQGAVRQGKVEIGFPEQAVYLALGKPDRKYTRQTESGVTAIWSYVDYTTTTERQRVDGTFRVRDPSGTYRTIRDSIWVDVDRRTEYEKLRVEIRDGQVSAIERVQR